jgi:hypothetical protein
MADPRPVHFHRPAASLYGPKGPEQNLGQFTPRPMTTTLRFGKAPPPEPASISEHISNAVGKIPGLSSRQKLAVHAAMVTLCRDISFVKMVHDQVGWARGPPLTKVECCRPSRWTSTSVNPTAGSWAPRSTASS